MSEYREVIAKIESTFLGIEDHGIFTAFLHVTYGSGGQGIGGYAMDEYDGENRVGTAYGMEWIRRVLLACGVDSWEKLSGRTVYLLKTPEQDRIGSTGAIGIRPLPTEPGREFIFDDIKHLAEKAVPA
jgi:hypothetical protein